MLLLQVDEGIGSATAFLKALSESGFPTALIFLGLVFLMYLIIQQRGTGKQDERDAKRSQMDADNLAKALNNRDSETAKALEALAKSNLATNETALAIANRALISSEAQRTATENNTAAIEHGNQPRLDLIAATVAQTTEFSGLKTGVASQEIKMDSNQLELMRQFDELKASMEKLLKATETKPDTQTAIMSLLELNTKLLRKLIDLLTPPETEAPTVASIEKASVAVDAIDTDKPMNITPGPDVGIADVA